jgi:hypothetical protein
MAEKIQSTRGDFTQLTSFQLKYWSVLESLSCILDFIWEGKSFFTINAFLVQEIGATQF